jgi:hypothetical protein
VTSVNQPVETVTTPSERLSSDGWVHHLHLPIGTTLMNTATDWRLESAAPHTPNERLNQSPGSTPGSASGSQSIAQSTSPLSAQPSVQTSSPANPAAMPGTFAANAAEDSSVTLSRSEVSMYSPASIAFFGITGSAVGAAGLTGSFGGKTSLMVTAVVLAFLFVALLLARTVMRRRHGVIR